MRSFAILFALFALVMPALGSDFVWRAYTAVKTCAHSSKAKTYPDQNKPAQGGKISQCYTLPQGVSWTSLEINVENLSVQLFCNKDCKRSYYSVTNTNGLNTCSVPYPGCVGGSFRVEEPYYASPATRPGA